MTDLENLTTHQLIAKIETNDQRFRVALGVFIAVVFFVLAAVVLVQLRTLAGVREQLKQQSALLQAQKDNTEDLKNNTEKRLGKVSAQIDCIAQFFTQQNRQQAVITDLVQCQIVRPDGSIIEPNITGNSGSSSQPAGNAGSPQATSPSNAQQPSQPQNPPSTPTENPPVEVLGIPACVPFTGLCIR